ncbi:MAG: S8 family serine peptidase, partial [Candidatus Scalindua sp.]|nr:S8 family serine peptidase [Candidatus Scalindua sp.]
MSSLQTMTSAEVKQDNFDPTVFTKGSQPGSKARFAKGRFIVKYKNEGAHAVTECAHCILANKSEFQSSTADRSDTIDRLNRKYKIKGAKRLFMKEHEWSAAKSKKRWHKKMKSIKSKFARRSKRIPKGTEVKDLSNIYIIDVPEESDIGAITEEFNADPHVEYAEPDYTYSFNYVPNDPSYNSQWAHQNIESESAWDIEKGNSGVVIAIVDSGVDYNHVDLSTNIWVNPGEISGNGVDDDGNGYIDDVRGWDFYNADNSPMDDVSHGTHCAGIAAAKGNNSIGVTGIAPNTRIMALRIGGTSGPSTVAAVEAIEYAADNGADIISNSWGGPSYSSTLNDAVEYANSLGVLLLAAAGNEDTDVSHYPSGYSKVLSVGATDQNDARAWFSSYGADVDVAAPGVNILSTIPSNGYDYVSGTSMSTPLVAGLAGLILSEDLSLTNDDIKNVLINEVDEFGVDIPAPDQLLGKGRINAFKALQSVASTYQAVILSPTGDSISSTVDITGIADGDSYSVQIGEGSNPSNWDLVGSGVQDQNNYLTTLDTTLYRDGVHTIELIVNGSAGNVSDRVYIEVDNMYIVEPNSSGSYRHGDSISLSAIVKHVNGFYALEYAHNSAPDQWSSAGLQYSKTGDTVTGTWDTSVLTDVGNYTLRLRSTYAGKDSIDDQLISIDSYQNGWPKDVGNAVRNTSPVIADIDNDGDMEVIIFASDRVYVWNYDGSLYAGWPQYIPSTIESTVAVGNIDSDSEMEIIVSASSDMYIFNHDGTLVAGPIDAGATDTTAPIIYDMNGDNKILIGLKDDRGGLAMYNPDGTVYQGFNPNITGSVNTSPAYADIVPGIPGNEIVVHSFDSVNYTDYVYLLSSDGTTLWEKAIGGGRTVSPVLGDINGDGQIEIFVASGSYPYPVSVYAWDPAGNILSGNWPVNIDVPHANLALGDINNDSKMELLFTRSGSIHDRLYAVDSTGSIVWEAIVLYPSNYGGPSIGDIDGDGAPEVVIGDHEGKLHAFNHDSTVPGGWPRVTDSRIEIVPAIGDLDGDGDVEVVSVSYHGVVSVYDLNGAYDESTMQWPMYQHDPQHSGYYSSAKPVITISGITPVNVEVGTVYTDAGATANDYLDGGITASIVTGGLPIDTSALGSYMVTYDVTDSSGNAAIQVTRIVNVVDTTAPIITLSGSTPVDVEAGTIYTDAGATANDNLDGDITSSIVTGGLPIETNAPGSYTVSYDVTDSSGNVAIQVTRTVNVVDVSFYVNPIESYGGSQDASPTVTIEDGGATLRIVGNSWKSIDFPYTITSNTVLEFD